MTSCPRRMQTVVPAQALTLLNSPRGSEQAAAFARRLLKECGDNRTNSCPRLAAGFRPALTIDRRGTQLSLSFAGAVTPGRRNRPRRVLPGPVQHQRIYLRGLKRDHVPQSPPSVAFAPRDAAACGLGFGGWALLDLLPARGRLRRRRSREPVGRQAGSCAGAGEAGDLPVHARRSQSHRHVRSQADAEPAAWPAPAAQHHRRTAAPVHQDGRGHPRLVRRRSASAANRASRSPTPIRTCKPAPTTWPSSARAITTPSTMRRRSTCSAPARADGPAVSRLLGDLRPGQRVGEPAGLRRHGHDRRCQGRSAGLRPRLPPRHLSAHRAPQRRLARAVPGRPPDAAAGARRSRPGAGAQRSTSRPGARAWTISRRASPPTSWLSACKAPFPRRSISARRPRRRNALYGLDDQMSARFGAHCLIARRLVERGVRFVQIVHGQRRRRRLGRRPCRK